MPQLYVLKSKEDAHRENPSPFLQNLVIDDLFNYSANHIPLYQATSKNLQTTSSPLLRVRWWYRCHLTTHTHKVWPWKTWQVHSPPYLTLLSINRLISPNFGHPKGRSSQRSYTTKKLWWLDSGDCSHWKGCYYSILYHNLFWVSRRPQPIQPRTMRHHENHS